MRLSSRGVQCGEEDVYYSPLKSWAFIPGTKKNEKLYSDRKDLYAYKFAFKKVHN